MSTDARTDPPDFVSFLLLVGDLIQTHGFDNGQQERDGKVPLRLHEAMKIALDEPPNRPSFLLPTSKRDLISKAWEALERAACDQDPTELFLTDWLVRADTDAVYKLITDTLVAEKVRP